MNRRLGPVGRTALAVGLPALALAAASGRVEQGGTRPSGRGSAIAEWPRPEHHSSRAAEAGSAIARAAPGRRETLAGAHEPIRKPSWAVVPATARVLELTVARPGEPPRLSQTFTEAAKVRAIAVAIDRMGRSQRAVKSCEPHGPNEHEPEASSHSERRRRTRARAGDRAGLDENRVGACDDLVSLAVPGHKTSRSATGRSWRRPKRSWACGYTRTDTDCKCRRAPPASARLLSARRGSARPARTGSASIPANAIFAPRRSPRRKRADVGARRERGPGRADRARSPASSCTSTTPGACTGICGSSTTGRSRPGRYPNGIPDDPRRNRKAVHVEDHPLEYIDFHGTIPAGEYGAGEVKIWDHGTYECEKWREDEVIAVFHGEHLQGRYALFQAGREDKDWMIHRMDPPTDESAEQMPEFIAPMLARLSVAASDRRAGLGLRGQVGRRARDRPLASPGRIHLISRNGNDITRRLSRAARTQPGPRLTRGHPRRGDRRLRQGRPAQLRGSAGPHAPPQRGGRSAPREQQAPSPT